MARNLPPIPKEAIGEVFVWRDWLSHLEIYIQQVQSSGVTWDVPVGGTGTTTFTAGYVKANGTSPLATVATIPYADITGTPTGYSGAITTAKLTSGGATGTMTFVNGILTAQVAAT